ncbi:MAG: hypothetical protein H6696_20420 [Deferribacteres bacterium]|nr:hypothetical protein [candidate division KSB1 bacterium]MCB9504297.1 hypothetical protein [Deferribacteres bacterium]
MTKNLTMAVDENLLKKARKVAIDKNTTVSALIRGYLEQLIEREERRKDEIIRELDALYNSSTAVVGDKTWSRDDLHER